MPGPPAPVMSFSAHAMSTFSAARKLGSGLLGPSSLAKQRKSGEFIQESDSSDDDSSDGSEEEAVRSKSAAKQSGAKKAGGTVTATRVTIEQVNGTSSTAARQSPAGNSKSIPQSVVMEKVEATVKQEPSESDESSTECSSASASDSERNIASKSNVQKKGTTSQSETKKGAATLQPNGNGQRRASDSSSESESESTSGSSQSESEESAPPRTRVERLVGKEKPRQVSSSDSTSESDSDESSDDDEPKAKPQPKSKPVAQKAATAKRQTSSSSSEDESESESSSGSSTRSSSAEDSSEDEADAADEADKSLAVSKRGDNKRARVPEFIRPDFYLRKVDESLKSNQVASMLKDAKKENKQIWYFTAPASLPISVLEEMEISTDEAAKGLPILNHGGASYGLTIEQPNSANQVKILIPRDGAKYGLLKQPLDQVMHLKRITHLPTGQFPASNPSAAAQTSNRTPRAQPQGLKIRYLPIGVTDSPAGNAGLSASSVDQDMPDAPPPRPVGTTRGLDKSKSERGSTEAATTKQRKKRKHSDDEEDEPADFPKKQKLSKKGKHRMKEDDGEAEQQPKPRSKKPRTTEKAEAEAEPAAELPKLQKVTPVMPPHVNGGSTHPSSAFVTPTSKIARAGPSAAQSAPAKKSKSALGDSAKATPTASSQPVERIASAASLPSKQPAFVSASSDKATILAERNDGTAQDNVAPPGKQSKKPRKGKDALSTTSSQPPPPNDSISAVAEQAEEPAEPKKPRKPREPKKPKELTEPDESNGSKEPKKSKKTKKDKDVAASSQPEEAVTNTQSAPAKKKAVTPAKGQRPPTTSRPLGFAIKKETRQGENAPASSGHVIASVDGDAGDDQSTASPTHSHRRSQSQMSKSGEKEKKRKTREDNKEKKRRKEHKDKRSRDGESKHSSERHKHRHSSPRRLTPPSPTPAPKKEHRENKSKHREPL